MARVSMPTQNQRLSFVINDFSGGLVNNVNDVKMKDNQSTKYSLLLEGKNNSSFPSVF